MGYFDEDVDYSNGCPCDDCVESRGDESLIGIATFDIDGLADWEYALLDEARKSTPISERARILNTAMDCVTKQRNNQYGPPTQDFSRSAEILTILGFRFGDQPILSHHIAMIQIAIKMSRATWNPEHEDNWVDIAGYAACAHECVVEENKP